MKDYFADLQSSGNPLTDVAQFLLAAGREETLAHCRAVAAQARELADRFGLDSERVNLAATCHDLAAVAPHNQAVAVALAFGLQPDAAQVAAPVLLHGPIAAVIMQERLGIDDEKVLDAVRYHSTCRPGATELELAVFVADKIALDPRSPVSDFVPAVREAAENSLREAAFVYLDWVVKNGPRLGWLVHPLVSAARDDFGKKQP